MSHEQQVMSSHSLEGVTHFRDVSCKRPSCSVHHKSLEAPQLPREHCIYLDLDKTDDRRLKSRLNSATYLRWPIDSLSRLLPCG